MPLSFAIKQLIYYVYLVIGHTLQLLEIGGGYD